MYILILDLKLCGFKIKLGASIKKIVQSNTPAAHISKIKDIYGYRKYILYPNVNNREVYVLLKEHATVDDILCAYFHAVIMSIVICAINDVNLVRNCTFAFLFLQNKKLLLWYWQNMRQIVLGRMSIFCRSKAALK